MGQYRNTGIIERSTETNAEIIEPSTESSTENNAKVIGLSAETSVVVTERNVEASAKAVTGQDAETSAEVTEQSVEEVGRNAVVVAEERKEAAAVGHREVVVAEEVEVVVEVEKDR